MPYWDIIISFEFSVIKKPSKCIASVPHMISTGILIFKNFNPAFGFWPECCRSIITAAGHCWCWSLVCETKLLAQMLCQMRNSVESSHFNNNIRSYNSAILAKAKNTRWPFNGPAVKRMLDKGWTVVQAVQWGFSEGDSMAQVPPSIMCPPRHWHYLVMTTEKDMEQHIWCSRK